MAQKQRANENKRAVTDPQQMDRGCSFCLFGLCATHADSEDLTDRQIDNKEDK